jgi:hypothetical protein
MTQILHEELQSEGLRIQVLCPGVVATEFHQRQGPDLSAVPRMSAEDVVTASLRDLELREVVCPPGVEEAGLLQAVSQADLAALGAQRPRARQALPSQLSGIVTLSPNGSEPSTGPIPKPPADYGLGCRDVFFSVFESVPLKVLIRCTRYNSSTPPMTESTVNARPVNAHGFLPGPSRAGSLLLDGGCPAPLVRRAGIARWMQAQDRRLDSVNVRVRPHRRLVSSPIGAGCAAGRSARPGTSRLAISPTRRDARLRSV